MEIIAYKNNKLVNKEIINIDLDTYVSEYKTWLADNYGLFPASFLNWLYLIKLRGYSIDLKVQRRLVKVMENKLFAGV